MTGADVEHVGGLELESEFEHQPVPASHRKSTPAVAAVWFGFPMILTCAVFGGVITALLGFRQGLLAIVLGNVVLMLYVGALSYLSGESGLNFALVAGRVFGRYGYTLASGFLATIVVGWFAFQTGLTGLTVNQSFGWNEKLVTLLAGILFIAITFIGIRALSVLGMVAAPLFLVVAAVALWLISRTGGLGDVWNYPGVSGGAAATSIGAAVTLVVATFADSGTMTGDFTRWSRNGRAAVLASSSAFPVANLVAFLVGAVIVASGAISDPQVNGGNFLPVFATGHGWLLSALALVFIVVNLGSVCTHCLYNGAVGWSHILGSRMRLLTVVLGIVGTVAALAGVWSLFLDWLNILGVFVPPIGAVILTDYALRRPAVPEEPSGVRWTAFAGWAVGALAAGIVHFQAPQYVEVLVGMLAAALTYAVLVLATGRSGHRARPGARVPEPGSSRA
ncbi:cytosine permease [Geodermatophilus ruber]|uniref:Cytosine permease n=1 Tax=Geodermatophilus ruber TaxID=504800 RepID=A0A1I4ILW5_9ACTN|nr:cytosine permease [Geodermatophilus ruber]SFL55358.1 cytosine permease [Geodermatophilus ruber]